MPAEKIDRGHGFIKQQIKYFIKRTIMKEGESFRSLIRSSKFLILLPSSTDEVLSWAAKNPKELPWYDPHFFQCFNNMVNLAKTTHHAIGGLLELLKPIMREVMEIYEKGLSVTWLQSHMNDQVSLFFNSFQQTVNLAEKFHLEFACAIQELKTVDVEPIMDVKWGISVCFSSTMQGGLGSVKEDIKSIKSEVMEMYEKMYGIGGLMQIKSSSHEISSKPTSPVVVEEETIVGLEDAIMTIMELLTEQHEKELKSVPIIGMPGLGKTTLAKRVYSDPLIAHHFYIRAWTNVYQAYQKRDLLLTILNSAHIQLNSEIDKMRDEDIGVCLYKSLKGMRYLVVMDDLWEIKVWDDLKRYFPNDNNGSRIMFTSRPALHANPYNLRSLDEDESWELLGKKTFGKESCPRKLLTIGKQISKKCQGLPLAIVVVSGLLVKNDKTQEWWSHVAKSVSSYIASDPDQYMETLSLSFNHLPLHLKPCFLYFGAFPEDFEIPVRQVIWLWVSEGFIRHNDLKNLEDVAEDYLMDLIDRSLVVVSKKRHVASTISCVIYA
ncbi:putative late blight resistance protein homolog R1A-10 [Cornus florida]|uniref:putative late blight resistance protein homolog R1A-10 n=1 Tax=Cornus florida TaxID=4283 RepID=UPI0028980A1E|nr:putative late blight resistance protein homolog R1A-10 [Cornus florida]